MKHLFCCQQHPVGARLLTAMLLSALLSCVLILPTFAEDASPWDVIPISETQASEPTTQPNNSTSVGNTNLPNRETAPAVSYGLRVMAAREEMVFAGLCGNELSFTAEDIRRAMNLSELNYITVQSLPEPGEGTLFVGSVGASEGQVISAGSLSLLSFAAADDSKPSEATMEISVNGSDYTVTCRLCFLDRLNYTPTVALAPTVSLNIETYKGLPTAGTVSAYDPEGDEITYEIVRYAAHGRVSLTDKHTGAYIYTPDANFVGQDSFDYVVYDRYGNYSTSATVSITVTARPASVAYADIDGEGDAAAILSVSAMGLMNGTQVGSATYFKPADAISRVEFLVTAMQAAGITAETVASAGEPAFADTADIPAAMRPFVAYAVQKNYVSGKTVDGQLCFKPEETISRAEAAVILSNIIGYAVEDTVTAFADADTMPDWSGEALTSLRALGIFSTPDGNAHAGATMTRATTAVWLDKTVQLMGG
ncbi:MAG: S-layer homology domain-containing protein [Clostridia bacterium]|nr:S-layer homology domain-containing protein [Clostridia bacterium]